MRNYFLLALLLLTIGIAAQDKKAYQLFDKNGKKVSYKKLLKAAEGTQVIENNLPSGVKAQFHLDLFWTG